MGKKLIKNNTGGHKSPFCVCMYDVRAMKCGFWERKKKQKVSQAKMIQKCFIVAEIEIFQEVEINSIISEDLIGLFCLNIFHLVFLVIFVKCIFY